MNYALFAIAALIAVRVVRSMIQVAAHGVRPRPGVTRHQAATAFVIVDLAEAAAGVVMVLAGLRLS